MDKQKLFLNYKGSGVKTLNGFAMFFYVLSSLFLCVALIAIIGFISLYSDPLKFLSAVVSLMYLHLAIVSAIFGVIFTLLSSIAKLVLYKRAILENRYFFIDRF
jgi:hypothetical protein